MSASLTHSCASAAVSAIHSASFHLRSPPFVPAPSSRTHNFNVVLSYVGSPGARSVAASLRPPSIALSSAKYEKVGSCLVYAPDVNPKAILHFLGGAFIGATPDVFYSYFVELLVSSGFIVIATPYDVTFNHTACIKDIRAKFARSLELLDSNGLSSGRVYPGQARTLPFFGVGHSNGALLQILSGTRDPPFPVPGNFRGNVIISYNNKPASEAVPFFDQVGPAVVQATPVVQNVLSSGPGIVLSLAEQILENVERTSQQVAELLPPDIADPVGRFADQIGPVLQQVQRGTSEFTPPPADNLRTIAALYSAPATLLIRFSDDSFDETQQLETTLRSRTSLTEGVVRGSLESILLTGTHATPLAPDLRWQVGPAFTPADAVAVAVKAAALSDLRSLARTVVSWLNYQF